MTSANLSVLVGKDFACIKIGGRANFTSSPDFKTLLNELAQKGFNHFIIDLSECMLMDSTFLGVLAGFGMKLNPNGAPTERGIELYNATTRVSELLENLGAAQLFQDDHRRAATARHLEGQHARIHQSVTRADHPDEPGGA
jgi:anti-anti-sigma factor